MKLKVQPLDIKVGKFKVVLNTYDAKELGIIAGDRVRLKGIKSITAIVDTTDDMVSVGMVGTYQEAQKALGLQWTEPVDVMPAKRPSSIEFIKKMMRKEKLTKDEVYNIVRDVVDESLSDIELSAFIVASEINSLTDDEVEWLTRAMIDTGERIEFDTHPIMDKHSIGGVPGNKISLLVVPIVAAAGLMIPKTSSRAITGAGGTADLMEMLSPVAFSASEIKEITEKTNGALVWGGGTNIAPADDKLIRIEYPLSADPHCQLLASIMAKKGAVGADNVVIDIPTGNGTKVPTLVEGRKLARDLISLGERLGMNVECAMTYGSSPVGRTVGPALEVNEALKVLETMQGPNSLIEKSVSLAGILLEMGGVSARGRGHDDALEYLRSGKAHAKMMEIIEAQGGDPNVKSGDIVPGEHKTDLKAVTSGYIIELDNKRLVEIARILGAPNDKHAGIVIHKKKGELVKVDDTILTLYAEKDWKLTQAIESAQRETPIVVEGMLLERMPKFREV